jgi:sugar phosphate isomerase/epimerase
MLYIAAHIAKDAAPTETVRELAGYGFERIELAGPADWSAFDEEGLVDLAEDNDLSLILHNDFPPQMEDFVPNLATQDAEEQTRLVRLLDEAFRLSQSLRAKVYSLQAGFAWDRLC